MKFKRRIQVVLGICVFLIILLAFYFQKFQKEFQKDPSNFILKNERLYKKEVFYHKSNGSSKSSFKKNNLSRNKQNFRVAAMVGLQINAKLQDMNFTVDPRHKLVVVSVMKELQSDISSKLLKNITLPWKIAERWVSETEIYPQNARGLGNILMSMHTYKIVKSEVPSKGSQLKILLTLEGNQSVIFKPMRLPRDHIILENPYAGPDRHNGEIVAFHLNRLLDFRRVPLTIGRKVSLPKEIMPVSSKSLLKTFTRHHTEGTTCFYGVCHYCRPTDQACSDSSGMIEGAMILWLPKNEKYALKKLRNPWRRTYKKNSTSRWESEINYCQRVIKAAPFVKYKTLLLDLIDISIFDYLIGNADRHTLELFANNKNPSLIFIDNGKSFGNPYWDELTILAPLYQCCKIRRITFEKLTLFVDSLASSIDEITRFDKLYPLLTTPHLEALDRRLRIVLTTIELCMIRDQENNVLQ